MSIYTTPLHIGYFFGLLIWILLLIRGYQEQRLSDKLLGWIMFILAMELQDYTFGFSGINVLWNELNGFPRNVSLLFGPVVYLYFLAQTNREFVIKRSHIWHFVPYFIYFLYHIIIFIQGPETVVQIQESTLNLVLHYFFRLTLISSFVYYLSKCLVIYRDYRKWSKEQFSNLDLLDFRWFRNFLYGMIFWLLCREIMNVVDAVFHLDFYQDWWWNLALVMVVLYIGLTGYAQNQPARINYDLSWSSVAPNAKNTEAWNLKENDRAILAEKLSKLMTTERLYLQPELTLYELAQHLQSNAVQLSATINQAFGKNFNEYINGFRIEEFIRNYAADTERKYTMLGMAFNAGFNSKATFNRAFKKIKGVSPQKFFRS